VKVLHLYSGNLFGGVETLLISLARHRMLNAEMDTRFALCFEGRLSRELEREQCPAAALGHVKISFPWSVFRGRAKLSKLLRDAPVDAIICHSPWACAIFGIVARRRKIPLILWLHDAIEGRHWLERWAIRIRPDRVIYNSHFTKKRCEALFAGIPGDVVYCPVSAPAIYPEGHRARVREALGVPQKSVLLVVAARLQPWKGQRLLMRALGRMAAVSGWYAIVLGGPQRPAENSYLAELQRLARSLGIVDRIKFLGERSDVAEIFAASDIHCQTNEAPEPFGIAWIEALYAGLRIVTTKHGGAEEIMTDRLGVLVPPGDVGALVAALKTEIEAAQEAPARSPLGPARARELCDPGARILQLQTVIAGTVKERVE